MIKKSLLGIIFTLSLLSMSNAAEVLDIGAGAKSIGLGRAYNAVSQDGYAIFSNPAGIAGISSKEVVSMFGNLSNDAAYTMFGFIMPLKSGVLSIGYAGSRTGDIYGTTIETGTGRIASASTFNWGNEIYLISYSRHKERAAFGATVKYYKKGTGQMDGGEGKGINMDAGMLYDINSRLRIGVLAKNILINVGSIRWGNGYKEELPLELKCGLNFKLRDNAEVLFDVNSKAGNLPEIKFGIEWFLRKSLALRFGAEQLAPSSTTKYINLSAGTGLILGAFKIDYAYYNDVFLPYNSRHLISMSIKLPLQIKTTK